MGVEYNRVQSLYFTPICLWTVCCSDQIISPIKHLRTPQAYPNQPLPSLLPPFQPPMAPQSPTPSKPHFLIITFPAQGHLNPALHLAHRLASSSPSPSITFSTAASAHAKMFPSLPSPTSPLLLRGITYLPFSDGLSSLPKPDDPDHRSSLSRMQHSGSAHLLSILQSLASSGRPVTRLIYTMMVPWAADVAASLRIPTALYWIQSAHVLSIYHHFFNGHHHSLITSHAKNPTFTISFPSLPPLQIKDLPSFLTITSPDEPFADILDALRGLFRGMSSRTEKPRVLVNSFDELETNALRSMEEDMELAAVGPVLVEETGAADIFEEDEREYMEWLDSNEERSVVYVAFGSVRKMGEEEAEEIARGLAECRRPYLWVVRRDGGGKDGRIGGGEKGMVVEWCKQGRVLGHKAVGCFVTHCGWNSTVEGLVKGVPMVAMPGWSDQVTNAWLMEREWGVAVRAEVGENGRVGWGELRRCLDVVMGEEERGVDIRRNVGKWKEAARKAVDEGGSSWTNLKEFVGLGQVHA